MCTIFVFPFCFDLVYVPSSAISVELLQPLLFSLPIPLYGGPFEVSLLEFRVMKDLFKPQCLYAVFYCIHFKYIYIYN